MARVDHGAIFRKGAETVLTEQRATQLAARTHICSPGQTEAAHGLCSRIPGDRKHHHLQPGVGHYGVFSGSRWEAEVYPVLRTFIDGARAEAEVAAPA